MHQSAPPLELFQDASALELMKSLPDCICLANSGGYLVWLNDHWETVLGYTKQELMSRPFLDFIHPGDKDATLRELGRLGDGKTTRKFVNRYYHKQGHVVRLSWSSRGNQDGTIFAVAQDVSEEFELRRQAESRAELLGMAEDIVGLGTWRVDLVAQDVYWSRQVFAIHGVTPEHYTPSLEDNINFYHPEDRAAVRQAIEASLESGQDFDFVLRLIRADGVVRWVEARGRPQYGSDGPVAISGVFRDVTEQREHEQSLHDAREHALEASRAKSLFLANMSHEVRTPMNGVLGMAELLGGTRLDPEQSEFVEHIQNSGQALVAILNDILDLSKIEAGQIALEETSFNVERVVNDVVLTLAGQAADKGIDLHLDIDPHLPRAYRGDPLRFRQILLNLTSNAVKFTDHGSVEVAVSRQDAGLEVRVTDSGIGIPRERQQAIFRPFAQADDSTTRRFGGTGLGLTICRQILDISGGGIELDSEAGRGTTIAARLPYPVVDQRPLVTHSDSPADCIVITQSPRRREIIQRLLEAAGHRVLCSEESPRTSACLKLSSTSAAVIIDVGALDAPLVASLQASGHRILGLCPHLSTRESIGFSVDALIRVPIYREGLLTAVEQRPRVAPSIPPASEGVVSQSPHYLRILLAEDNPVNTKVATRMLDKLGHQVHHAADGAAAVRAWQEGAFDLVLMDVHMPELDGFEATRRIRELESGRSEPTAIVALTANAMKGDEERCLRAGMDGYLAKPLNSAELRELLQRLTRSHGHLQRASREHVAR